jgi:hypothetical protein
MLISESKQDYMRFNGLRPNDTPLHRDLWLLSLRPKGETQDSWVLLHKDTCGLTENSTFTDVWNTFVQTPPRTKAVNFIIQAEGVAKAFSAMNQALAVGEANLLRYSNPDQYQKYQLEQLNHDITQAVFYSQSTQRMFRPGIKRLGKVTRIQDEVVINLDDSEIKGLLARKRDSLDAAVFALASPDIMYGIYLSTKMKAHEIGSKAIELLGYNTVHAIYRIKADFSFSCDKQFSYVKTAKLLYVRSRGAIAKMPKNDSDIMNIYYHLAKDTAEGVVESVIGQGGNLIAEYGKRYYFFDRNPKIKFWLKKDSGWSAFNGLQYTILFPTNDPPSPFFQARVAGEDYDMYASHKREYKYCGGYKYDEAILDARVAVEKGFKSQEWGIFTPAPMVRCSA